VAAVHTTVGTNYSNFGKQEALTSPLQ